jgi:hypothetical protein
MMKTFLLFMSFCLFITHTDSVKAMPVQQESLALQKTRLLTRECMLLQKLKNLREQDQLLYDSISDELTQEQQKLRFQQRLQQKLEQIFQRHLQSVQQFNEAIQSLQLQPRELDELAIILKQIIPSEHSQQIIIQQIQQSYEIFTQSLLENLATNYQKIDDFMQNPFPQMQSHIYALEQELDRTRRQLLQLNKVF